MLYLLYLRKNFYDGWERDGASFVVYHKGKKVVDLWGGYADSAALRKWEKDTMSVAFSSTKAVAALCVAMLVDRGHVKYDDLVTKFWPEFGSHGKENVTVQWVMSHMVSSFEYHLVNIFCSFIHSISGWLGTH